MSDGFTLLWGKTLYSSLWLNGSKELRLLFFTMLMLKDSNGVVLSSVPGLVHASKLTLEEVEKALGELLAKDDFDTSGVEGGIRIRKIVGGWQVVNHDLYRFSTAAKREFWRSQKAEQREKIAARKAHREQKRLEKLQASNQPDPKQNGANQPETRGEKIAKEMHLDLAPGTLSRDEDIPF